MSTYRIHTITSQHTVEGVHGINYVNHLLFFNTEGKVFAGFAADTWERFEKVEDTEVLPATSTSDEPLVPVFNRGDHVRVEPGTTSFYGGSIPSPYRGVVTEANDFNDAHVNVDFEGRPGSVMVKADLIKVTPGLVTVTPNDDEPLANWERELLFRADDYQHGKELDVHEVKALPDGQRVEDSDGDVWTLGDDGYWENEDEHEASPERLFTWEPITFYNPPAATVHEPTEAPEFKIGDRVRILPDARYCHNRYDVELDDSVTHDSVGTVVRQADTQGDLSVTFTGGETYYVNAEGLALAYTVGTELTKEQFEQAPTGTRVQGSDNLIFEKTDGGAECTHYGLGQPRPGGHSNDADFGHYGKAPFTVIA